MKHKERLKELEKELYEGNAFEVLSIENTEYLIKRIKVLTEALEFYANKNNWRDLWEVEGKESPDFKYFFLLRQRTKDFDQELPYHFYAGKRARKALENES
jgi:hypothetical protein